MYDFSGRAVVVSGATRGLGFALARAMAQEGANLALLARDGDAIHTAAYELKKQFGVDAIGRACDVRDPYRVKAVVDEAASRFGRIDLAVSNAAILGAMTHVADYDPQAWANTMDVNLNGAFYLTHHALRHMRRTGGGRVVFITSSVGLNVRAGWGAYSVSKYGVEGLMKLVALESVDTLVTACSINPGGTATEMRKAAFPDEDQATLPPPAAVAQAFLRILRLGDQEINGQHFNARDHL
jgi:NAD(P)-dependent dehydrogenase (short-subunit alcohol dehydrogenase family)